MKAKQIAALMLALLIALPFSVSCSKEKEKDIKSTDTSAATDSGTNESEYAEIDSYVGKLAADCNFDGATFTVLGSESVWPTEEEITGNLESDALWNRYREVEEKFNVDMTHVSADGSGYETSGAEIADRVHQDVLSGGSSYDLIFGNLMTCGQVMLNSGCIRPVDTLDGIDLNRDWWTGGLEDMFSIGGHLYFLTGKITNSYYGDPHCIFYNKQIAENYGIEDMYPLVKSGEWTIDKMVEIASVIPGGTGTYRYALGGAAGGLCFYFGGGYKICDRDEDGNPTIPKALTSDQINYIDKLSEIFYDEATVFSDVVAKNNDTYESEDKAFQDNAVLFWATAMGAASAMREYDVEFGILPMPKKDTAQKDYISYSSAWWGSGCFVSQNIKDEKMTAYITEALAALSAKYLEPAYYEKALKGRSTYDTESRDMLDLIYRSGVVDLADTYQWGEIVGVINDACLGDSGSLVSSYNASVKLANASIKSLLKKVSANTNK